MLLGRNESAEIRIKAGGSPHYLNGFRITVYEIDRESGQRTVPFQNPPGPNSIGEYPRLRVKPDQPGPMSLRVEAIAPGDPRMLRSGGSVSYPMFDSSFGQGCLIYVINTGLPVSHLPKLALGMSILAATIGLVLMPFVRLPCRGQTRMVNEALRNSGRWVPATITYSFKRSNAASMMRSERKARF